MKEKILEKLYAIPDVEFALTQAGAPCTFDELGFSKNLVKEAFLYSRFVRSRVTILDILDEAGVLEGYVEELIK
jgi:glycerol dehydrogenase-like iron-containing ADH family enzyme